MWKVSGGTGNCGKLLRLSPHAMRSRSEAIDCQMIDGLIQATIMLSMWGLTCCSSSTQHVHRDTHTTTPQRPVSPVARASCAAAAGPTRSGGWWTAQENAVGGLNPVQCHDCHGVDLAGTWAGGCFELVSMPLTGKAGCLQLGFSRCAPRKLALCCSVR